MNKIMEITETNFETEVLQAPVPVVVDFYAPWCGPCKMLGPLLDQLAGEFDGRLKFVKVNVDNAPELAAGYEVTGVPTLASFNGGKLLDTMVGLAAPKALKAWLETAAVKGASSTVAPR